MHHERRLPESPSLVDRHASTRSRGKRPRQLAENGSRPGSSARTFLVIKPALEQCDSQCLSRPPRALFETGAKMRAPKNRD